ncbi:zinc-dependent metalloprotease [Mycolicibacterium fallax]|jgi:coenzyme F420 biosynthesis associated uncharacterized protein|uniref:Hydrolase n=2 Tax=Mycolicibacterium fallax TaxID=1793 RepID=A0A1X1RF81_MYCFA|nr:zinc-dependent metalloprotease [Mycolicibacterium fallax]ORV04526.1 hydrolase [Mycolicibacterium fallax]BBY99743.1 hydrolase [Mycolicibacterium fallax]HOW95162.1 zinc-dependent metalloprotease [Mycolicibacterium fallax]
MTEASPARAVDWAIAAELGARLARPGPPISDYTRSQVIAALADAARRAEPLVREVSGLSAGGPVPEAGIVDRAQWIRAAAGGMRAMLGGAEPGPGPGGLAGLAAAAAGRIAGVQTGAVLAFISSGILGQYDPFGADGPKLLLVYPNIVAVERQLQVRPEDFRLWVCLHEVTHRVQFTANPWLAGYMSDTLAVLTADAGDDVTAVLGRLADYVRDRRDGVIGLLRAAAAEPQAAALDRLLVLGTLLEGHADHVMDGVGPAAVPSVGTIRARFDRRRGRQQSPIQRVLRALLGVDAKIAQYTRGKAFVDAVVGQVGVARFNAIWTGPDTLPLPDEIDVPRRWIDRVL